MPTAHTSRTRPRKSAFIIKVFWSIKYQILMPIWPEIVVTMIFQPMRSATYKNKHINLKGKTRWSAYVIGRHINHRISLPFHQSLTCRSSHTDKSNIRVWCRWNTIELSHVWDNRAAHRSRCLPPGICEKCKKSEIEFELLVNSLSVKINYHTNLVLERWTCCCMRSPWCRVTRQSPMLRLWWMLSCQTSTADRWLKVRGVSIAIPPRGTMSCACTEEIFGVFNFTFVK